MTASHNEAAKSVHSTLSLLTADNELPEILGNWTIGSVTPQGIELQFVKEQDSIQVVKTLMHICDFSQIPVLSSNRRQLRGYITWKSLARFGNSGKDTAVDVMVPGGKSAKFADPLLEHIEDIIDEDFVFVRDERGIFTSVATTTDLAHSFYDVAGPFMKLRDIEQRIRRILQSNFSNEEIRQALRTPADAERVRHVDDLNFGHYVEIIQRPKYWDRIGLPFDRPTIVKHLEQVNQVRNRVMHFRPEPLTHQQSLVLDWCLNWLTECDGIPNQTPPQKLTLMQ